MNKNALIASSKQQSSGAVFVEFNNINVVVVENDSKTKNERKSWEKNFGTVLLKNTAHIHRLPASMDCL